MAERAATATLTAPALAAYDLREAAAIRAFVERHPEVLDTLAEAPARIAAVFGEVSPLRLELLYDPEEADTDHLRLLIPAGLSPPEALARLDELDDDWWRGVAASVDGRLVIDVDFQ